MGGYGGLNLCTELYGFSFPFHVSGSASRRTVHIRYDVSESGTNYLFMDINYRCKFFNEYKIIEKFLHIRGIKWSLVMEMISYWLHARYILYLCDVRTTALFPITSSEMIFQRWRLECGSIPELGSSCVTSEAKQLKSVSVSEEEASVKHTASAPQ